MEGTAHPLILRAYEHELPWPVLEERLTALDVACQSFAYEQVLELLASLVHEYTPTRHDENLLLWETLAAGEAKDAVLH